MIHVLFIPDPIEDKSSQFYYANVNKDRNPHRHIAFCYTRIWTAIKKLRVREYLYSIKRWSVILMRWSNIAGSVSW